MVVTAVGVNSQAGIIFTLLGAAVDEQEEAIKKMKKGMLTNTVCNFVSNKVIKICYFHYTKFILNSSSSILLYWLILLPSHIRFFFKKRILTLRQELLQRQTVVILNQKFISFLFKSLKSTPVPKFSSQTSLSFSDSLKYFTIIDAILRWINRDRKANIYISMTPWPPSKQFLHQFTWKFIILFFCSLCLHFYSYIDPN